MEENWDDPEFCLESVKMDGLNLEFVINQTPEICLEAVKQNGYALQYVQNQTPEICLEAIKEEPISIIYVKKQTPELIHYFKKYASTRLYGFSKRNGDIRVSEKEMEDFYKENPHLLLTL